MNKQMGAQLRKLATLHKRRMRAEAKAADIKREERELQQELQSEALRQGLQYLRLPNGTSLSMKEHTYPKVVDWNKLYKYIDKHHCPELLQKRVSTQVFREYAEAGTNIPGIEKRDAWKSTLTVKE